MGDGAAAHVNLPWLVRLRWLAVFGQASALAVAHWVFYFELTVWLALTAIGLVAASNVALSLASRVQRRAWAESQVMGSVMALDTVLLTVLLVASGGVMNPFTILYLVHITLSAVVLSARWTLLVSALSFAGYGALFLLPSDPHAQHGPHDSFTPHLQGMWLAFVVAAGLITIFVRQMIRASARQREQLREAGARHARLASITTLAAGAAHELGNPLGTIAIAAHDARLALGDSPLGRAVVEDLELILLEVERCRTILGSMAARAPEATEAPGVFTLDDLSLGIRLQLGEQAARIQFRAAAADTLELPLRQTTQSVLALVRNALDASEGEEPIVVHVSRLGADAHICVEDRGAGIPESIRARLGEPFFTTKEPGRGLGLGLFLARVFAENRGGELTIDSRLGAGTRARLRIPMGLLAAGGAVRA
jgi:two-component system sensor histidine kinase RegB